MADSNGFTPTPKMWDYLEAWCEPGLKQTLSAMAEKAGVSRQAVYQWYREVPGFVEWFNEEYSKRRLMRRPGAVNAMEQRAIEGDVQAYRAWMMTGGDLEYRPAGQNVAVNAGGPVEIIIGALATDDESPEKS